MILCVDECLFNMGLLNLRFCVMFFYHTGLYNCYCYFIFQYSFFFFLYSLMETYIDVNKLVEICELPNGGIDFLYPLLLFCGGVHGSVVVLGNTNPIVAQSMTIQIRVSALLFF